MSKNVRLDVALASAVLVVLAADSRFVIAQRIVVGGGNQSDRDKDKDDEEESQDNNNNNGQRGGRSSRSSNRSQEKINEFLKRAQGGQGGQGGQDGQQGQDGQGGRGGRGGQGGQGGGFGEQDEYREGDFDQFRRDGRGQFQNNNQFDLRKAFRPKEGSANVRIGGWQGERWQGSRDVKNWSQVFAGGKQPFSAQWYQEHPKAWKYDNNKANIWVTASLPGVYNWLGWGDVPPQFNVNLGPTRHFDISHYGQWYPLGVYSLMSGPGDMGTRVVQLAIDQHGHIAGNYYDMIADANYSISGDVRRQSQRVRWSLNKNKFIRFEAPLYRLLQPYGYITVDMPGGEQDWQFVRLEN